MAKNIKLEPILIWQGLLKCDRKSLTVFLALFEDGKGLSLLSDKLVDIKRKVGKAYDSFAREGSFNTGDNIEDSFAKRIEKTAHNIEESNLSNDVLKTALWIHLLEATSLLDDSLMSPRDVDRHCHNLANELTKNVAAQYRKENQSIIGKFRFSKKKKKPDLSFEDAIEYLVAKITKEAAEKDSQVASEIKDEISNLDSSVIEKSGVSDLTEATINKTLVTGGSLLGLMGGVQAAGFSAYIMAAQASAIIPLIGGKTLVSLLFVVTNPFFVIPAIVATGAISKNKLEKSIRQSFSTTISAFLVMRGMASETNVLESENLLASFEQNTQLVTKSSILRIKPQKQNLVTKVKISAPNLSKAEQKLLNSKVHISHESNKQILRIQPSSDNMVDNGAIAGLTFADFIYDIAAIDPQVIEATDFARKADISNVFEFAAFSEGLSGLSEASLRGHHANLMGYTAERLVASQLAKDGYVVEIPKSASQPGYDLLVDGHEFQVKCIEPENYSILEKHFDKYPETPVFVNAEMAKTISARQPEWAEHVFYVGGYTHEKASGLLTQALESGQNLDDYEVLSSVAIVSAVRNAIDWQKGEQSLQSATFNIAIDSLSRGGVAIAGGVAGTGLGMLLFGPAGAYILGGVSTVLGATQGNIITNRLDRFLDPDRENTLKSLANGLIEKCNYELASKIALLDEKISALSNSGISSYVKYRLGWERIYLQIAIKRHNDLMQNKSITGTKKIFKALRFASESTVHPYCLQSSYKEITQVLNSKVDRKEKITSLIKGWGGHGNG